MEKNTYPVEEWKVTEEKFVKDWNYRNETTFALSNGYIGTRGDQIRERLHPACVPPGSKHL